MKKQLLFCLLSAIIFSAATAQMKIGAATAPVAASVLELESTTQGFVLPRVSLTNITSNSPLGATILTSTMVYNTNASVTGGSGAGIYYWDGTKWNFVANATTTSGYWNTLGNAGTLSSTNFLGTTDNNGLAFRTNNVQRMLIDSLGDVAIGSTAYDPYNREKLLVDYGTTTSNTLANFRGSIASYFQVNLQNTSSSTNASTDFVATNNIGTDSTYYIDMGINSSTYTPSVDNFGGPNDGYLYINGRNLVMGTQSTNSDIVFLNSGGSIKLNQTLRIDGTTGNLIVGKDENVSIAPAGNTIRAPNAGSSSPANSAGGSLSLLGGTAVGSGTGGSINITGGAAVTGTYGAVNINTSAVSNATNINTGSSTGNVTVGNSANNIIFPKFTAIGSLIYTALATGQIGALAPSATAGQVLTSAGTGAAPTWASPTAAWALLGNSGTTPGTNFLGTTDNNGLVFKVNNTFAGFLDPSYATGNLYLGLSSGNYGTTTGTYNLAIGTSALGNNTSGSFNIALGASTLSNNTTGTLNTAIGQSALNANTTGGSNTAIGQAALNHNVTGVANTAIGGSALRDNTASGNIAIGQNAMSTNTTGSNNIAIGNNVNSMGLTTANNTAIGILALQANTGNNNTTLGYNSMNVNTSGAGNTAVGYNAAAANTTGANNVGIGYSALNSNSTGSNNTAIGYGADVSSGALSNATAIGYNAKVAASNALVLGGTGAGAVNVGIGITNPSYLLHVSGTGGTVISATASTALTDRTLYYLYNGAAGGGQLSLRSYGASYAETLLGNSMSGNTGIINLSGALITGTFNSADYIFGTNNSERMRITSTGYVGIGTSTPAYTLQIASASNPLYMTGVQATASFSTDSLLTIYNGVVKKAPYSSLPSGGGGSSWLLAGNSITAGNFLGTTNNLPLILKANNTQNAYLDGNDNAVFGPSSPASLTGSYNIASGYQVMNSTNTGNNNIALGQNAMNVNSGSFNIGVGYQVMLNGNSGNYNIAFGQTAMNNNKGSYNLAIGDQTLSANATGANYNFAFGNQAMNSTNTGSYNIAVGQSAMNTNSGNNNLGLGQNALTGNTGGYNIAIGNTALGTNKGSYNLGLGDQALNANATGGNYNIAVGGSTLSSNTGLFNIATGNSAMSNNKGSYNIGLGDQTLAANSNGANYNIAVGYQTMNNTNSGSNNLAFGQNSLNINSGNYNFVMGYQTMNGINSGSNNIAFGQNTLNVNSGNYNVALGYQAMSSNKGSYSLAIGDQTLNANGANYNLAMGIQAMNGTNTGSNNVAFGQNALNTNSGNYNFALGYQAMYVNQANYNFAFGQTVLKNNTTGNYNFGFGYNALNVNTTGTYNIALGSSALGTNTTGSYNTAIGYTADVSSPALNNTTAVGYNAKVGVSNGTVIGYNASLSTASTSANAVVIGSTGANVGIATSTPNVGANLDVNGTFKLGANASVTKNIISFSGTLSGTAVPAGTVAGVTFASGNTDLTVTIPAASQPSSTQATVLVSPNFDLPNGVSIASARLTSTTTVKIRFVNASSTAATLSGTNVYITINEF